MVQRARRSHENTHPVDWRGIVLAVVVAVLGALSVIETQEKAKMSAVWLPAAAGIVLFVAALGLLYLVEFAYRFVTQKARRGTARSMRNINTAKLEAALRRSTPAPGVMASMWSDQLNAECVDFACDLRDLLERSGWAVGGIGTGTPVGEW